MKLPDFLGVGTARAGTTSLHYYLRQHPGLFLPTQKEPCFFCFNGEKLDYKNGKFSFAVLEKEEYFRLFNKAKPEQRCGEISTPYLYLHDHTIKKIKQYYPQNELPSIVILLRNPVDRAYSHYLWKVRDGREKLSFDQALKIEASRMKENYSFDYFYAARGLYFESVQNFLNNFSSVKIIVYEDLKNNVEGTLKELCRFLGVRDDFKFLLREELNSSTMPRFAALGNIMTTESKFKFKILSLLPDNLRTGIREQFNRWNSTGNPAPVMSDEARNYLNNYYKEDISKLMSLTGLDLAHWIK